MNFSTSNSRRPAPGSGRYRWVVVEGFDANKYLATKHARTIKDLPGERLRQRPGRRFEPHLASLREGLAVYRRQHSDAVAEIERVKAEFPYLEENASSRAIVMEPKPFAGWCQRFLLVSFALAVRP